ncbi:type III toxin-antitoxin system ToxN/AbiQ family toxin [Fusobacterium massiliense]|uniref:type III toxin-antitoxin system ToxN/AbiQ family toxin n=1 Tax=Fusobacterium massiliense TaxID=1852365 RepID=UPI0021CC46C9|nr:type III toxin-antitoxin system ToxN/AbiQ family toxin [Fusobacterium massiliense]
MSQLQRSENSCLNWLKTATKLYEYMLLDKLPNNIKERCCNFKLLEEKAIEYDKEKYFYLNNYNNVLKL